MSRSALENFRLESMNQMESIKDRLSKDNCPQTMVTLERAIMFPSDLEHTPGERVYPTPELGLMINPFPKVVKGKKKKGKK